MDTMIKEGMSTDVVEDFFTFDLSSLTVVEASIILLFGFIFVIGVLLEYMSATLFIYHVIKGTKYFSTGFFYILTIGFCFDLISSMVSIAVYATRNATFMWIGIVLSWYSILLLGPWNTLMAINRFTAVWFWKKHDGIWSWKLVAAGIAGMFIYPFLVSAHLLIKNFYCIFQIQQATACVEIIQETSLIDIISNGAHVIIAAALGIFTAFASRCNMIVITPETRKFEQFLLVQSLLSLLLYGCYLYQFLTKDVKDESTFRDIITVFAGNYYAFFRISSILLLFILSKTVRQSFLNFYMCKCFCMKKEKTTTRKKSTMPVTIPSKPIIKVK